MGRLRAMLQIKCLLIPCRFKNKVKNEILKEKLRDCFWAVEKITNVLEDNKDKKPFSKGK